jgi:hypothetical protein
MLGGKSIDVPKLTMSNYVTWSKSFQDFMKIRCPLVDCHVVEGNNYPMLAAHKDCDAKRDAADESKLLLQNYNKKAAGHTSLSHPGNVFRDILITKNEATRNKVIEVTQAWISAEREAVGYMKLACDIDVLQTMEQYEEWTEACVGGDSHAAWKLLHSKLAMGAGGATENLSLRAFEAWRSFDNLTMGDGGTAAYFAAQQVCLNNLTELGEDLTKDVNQIRLVRATFGGLSTALQTRYREVDRNNSLNGVNTYVKAKALVVSWESYEKSLESLPSSSNDGIIAKRTEVYSGKKKYTKAEKRAYQAQKVANAEKVVASAKKNVSSDKQKSNASGGKKDHSEMTCHFCNKQGHIQHNCESYKASREAFQKSHA